MLSHLYELVGNFSTGARLVGSLRANRLLKRHQLVLAITELADKGLSILFFSSGVDAQARRPLAG